MIGYQPEKICNSCYAYSYCTKRIKKKLKGCKDHIIIELPKPPTSGSNAQKPEQIIKHIHIDISKEFLEEYKAEIEQEVAEKLYNEINKIIALLEFSVTINAESVAIHAEEIPLLLNGLKKQLEENERTKALFKPFNIPKK